MRIDLFDYHLPPDAIALRPADPRESAKLLKIDSQLCDHHIADLPTLLRPGDLLVVNDTRVIAAQLFGRKGEAKIAVTLHKQLAEQKWLAFCKPGKKLKVGGQVVFGEEFSAQVIEKNPDGDVTFQFNRSGQALMTALEQYGVMPIPPYIAAKRGYDEQDKSDYQTRFAQRQGAVAAPTAGLHFTESLLQKLEKRGIGLAKVTLHVGAGTFLPIKVDDTNDHRMYEEWGEVSPQTVSQINDTKREGGRVVVVGTTSLRILETAAQSGALQPFSGDTNIFIQPGFRFRVADLLFTNFHLPKSTLLMLVCAFGGRENILSAYQHAIEHHYRFYSYGDACLISPMGMAK